MNSQYLNRAMSNVTFPLLARSIMQRGIVLFHNPTAGVVVYRGHGGSHNVGYFSDDWVEVTDELCWEILPVGAQIVLTQE